MKNTERVCTGSTTCALPKDSYDAGENGIQNTKMFPQYPPIGGGFVFPLRRKVQGEIALVTGKVLHLHYKPFARASISLKLSLLAELKRYHNRFESMRLDLELGGERETQTEICMRSAGTI